MVPNWTVKSPWFWSFCKYATSKLKYNRVRFKIAHSWIGQLVTWFHSLRQNDSTGLTVYREAVLIQAVEKDKDAQRVHFCASEWTQINSWSFVRLIMKVQVQWTDKFMHVGAVVPMRMHSGLPVHYNSSSLLGNEDADSWLRSGINSTSQCKSPTVDRWCPSR